MTDLTDEQLVALIKEGKIMAFEDLVRRYEKKLKVFVGRWLSETGDVEEVVQDSLFKIYTHIGRVKTDKKFSSYLYAIAKNEAIDKLRKRKTTLPLLDIVPGQSEVTIYENVERNERWQMFYRAWDKLSEMQRRVLHMYFFEELSYRRIQARLNIPINSVKTILRRSKINLKKKLKNEK